MTEPRHHRPRRLLAATGALSALVLGGYLYQKLGGRRDARRHPPPGRLVDVGGHRLHALTMGEGSPTVVFDSALGGSCLSWSRVQPQVARFTRTCSYDRAGSGWSEAGPPPRTTDRIVQELHRLLAAAGVPGPYVLVGHSIGALTVRLYAARYPQEVAGLVLVDPADPGEWAAPSPSERLRLNLAARLARRTALLARFGVTRVIAALASSELVPLARAGVSAVTLGAIGKEAERILAPARKVPPDLRPALKSFWTQPKFFAALASQIECVPESATRVAAAGDLGGLPLVVLSAGDLTPPRRIAQAEMARLSTRGRQVIAPESGHWIPLDEPQLVIATLRELVDAIRRGSDLSSSHRTVLPPPE